MKIDVKVETEFLASIVQRTGVIDKNLLSKVLPEHFQVESYQWFVTLMIGREWKHLEWDYLDQELLEIKDDDTRMKYRNQFWVFYSKELKFEEDAANKFKAYIAYCILNSKVKGAFEGVAATSRVDFLIAELEKTAMDARQVLVGNTLPIKDYAEDYERRMVLRKEYRDNPSMNPRILTGIAGLDHQFILKAPMLVDFLAPFKRYKSIFLNAMGYAGLLQGFNVLHVTYENTIEMTMDRYDSMFSELNYNRISNMLITPAERAAMDSTFAWMNTWKNRLKVIKATSDETSVADVARAVDQLRVEEGWIPDLEVWDYLNIIRPSKVTKEERTDQKTIVWDLKRHADAYGVLIIEASQSNMEGAKAERLNLGHRGMSVNISQALDLCIAIDQTPEEREENIIVLSPHFFRNGGITIPEIVLDSDISRMSVSRELHRLWGNAIQLNPVKPV
jgi:hypothetical protein